MKRLTVLFLCLCLLLSVSGCHGEPDTSATDAPNAGFSGPMSDETLPPTYTQITNPIQIDPNSPGTIVSPQTGEYLETQLLANVPGQKTALLLSVRSDGTLDYIFSDSPSGDESVVVGRPVIRLSEAAFQYYTVAPDGSYTRQDDGWVQQLSDMMAQCRANGDVPNLQWYFSFYGCEGHILIQCTMVADGISPRVLFYHLNGGTLTQIPIPETPVAVQVEGMAMSVDLTSCSILYVEADGFVVCPSTTTSAEAGSADSAPAKKIFCKFAYDGTVQQTTIHDHPALAVHLDAGYGIAWFASDQLGQLTALRLEDNTHIATIPATDRNRLCFTITTGGNGLLMVEKDYDQENLHLWYYTQDTARELMADTTRYALGNPGSTPSLIAAVSDAFFYTWAEGTINGQLRQYRYAPQDAREPSSAFTVYALEDNLTVRTAAALWNRTHPDILCQYIVATDASADTILTTEDLIAQLNTQLVSGEGPDVLILDGLPIDSLMDKGFLAPLSGLDTSNVYPKLLERFTLEGTLYAVPGKMTPFLLGRTTKYAQPVESLEAFADLVEEKTGKLNCAFWGGTKNVVATGDHADAIYYVQFADEVFDLWYPAWSDAIWQDNRFNRETYAEFLTHTGRLVNHYSLETIDQLIPVYGELPKAGLVKAGYSIINQTDANLQDAENGIYGVYPYCLAATSYVGQRCFINHLYLTSPVPYALTGIPGPDGSGAALPTAIGALRAGGNTEAGLEFLQLLLSDEVQTSLPHYGIHAADGYPVTWRATPAMLDLTEETYGMESQITNDLEAALGDLRAVVLDTFLYDAAKEAALRYYEGELTLEEATEQVQSAVSIYLAEKQQ